MKDKIDLAFVFIGGVHQVLHLAPVAAEISRRLPGMSVHCICADDETFAALCQVAGRGSMKVTKLEPSLLARLLARVAGRYSARKGPLLLQVRWRARHACAIVAPERTSARLRAMGWRRPLIHFRHGAGDRAPTSEKRLRTFDLIVVPGEKDIERALAQGVERQRLRTAGYVKLDYLHAQPPSCAALFDNGLPTVLYNPHFDPATSSLGVAREVIAAFRAQHRYNLVFAPHVRSVENLSGARRQELEALAVPGRIIVDLGSPDLFNMRYVQAADLYLGDMSSQLYEFISRPRPVAFINAHGVQWRENPRYAGWHLGEVAEGAGEVMATIDRAFATHATRIARQEQAVIHAFGEYRGATARAADILMEYLQCAA